MAALREVACTVFFCLCDLWRVDGLVIHSLEHLHRRHRGFSPPFYSSPDLARKQDAAEDLSLPNTIASDVVNSPRGAVCPTLLHADIKTQSFIPAVNSTEGLEPGCGLMQEVWRLCGGPAGLVAQGYTGNWLDTPATNNDIRVLQGIFAWVGEHRTSDKPFDWNHERGPMLRKITGDMFARRVKRVLDFGCGGGSDLNSVKEEYGVTAKKDLLCLDIFHTVAKGVTPIVLDSTSDEAYNRSLNDALVGNRGSVDLAFSIVTFHHVNQGPNMRANAFRFISKVLSPGGLFIMAEWDNSVKPDRTIWFDLEHFFPSILTHDFCPGEPERLDQKCAYFGFNEWNSQIREASNGMLKFDKRKLAHPSEQAEYPGNSNRNFVAAWKKTARW